jgi:uridine phosphorylase
VKARSENPTNRPRTNADQAVAGTRTASPLLEFDAARVAIIEPSRHRANRYRRALRAVFLPGGNRRTSARGRTVAPSPHRPERGGRLPGLRARLRRPASRSGPSRGRRTRCQRVIALGCRKFIVCGGAGVLDGAIDVGDIVVPSSAIRDEGTSHHYLRPAREVAPTRRALAAIEEVLSENHHGYIRGKTWTTDAVYRETRQRVNRRRREGCVVVDMEAAAFFAVARFRRVECAQILYGGDSLAGRRWDPRGWNRHAMRERLFHLAAQACLRL